MLEKLIQDDVAAAKTPVLLVAYAGMVQHSDKIFIEVVAVSRYSSEKASIK